MCKAKSGTRAELESQSCKGDPKLEWAEAAVDRVKLAECGKRLRRVQLEAPTDDGDNSDTDEDLGGIANQKTHDPVWAGDIIFCTICGAYAESKAVKLRGQCMGRPNFDGTYGGAWGNIVSSRM